MIAEERLPALRGQVSGVAIYLATEVWPTSISSLRHADLVILDELGYLPFSASGAPHPPLPHPRDRERQLPLQKQLGKSRQTRKGENPELDEPLTLKPSSSRVSSQWKSRASNLSGNRHSEIALRRRNEWTSPAQYALLSVKRRLKRSDRRVLQALASRMCGALVSASANDDAANQRSPHHVINRHRRRYSIHAPTRPPIRKRKDHDETLAAVGSASGRTAKAGGTAT